MNPASGYDTLRSYELAKLGGGASKEYSGEKTYRNKEALKSMVYMVNCKKVGTVGCAVRGKSDK